MIKPLLFLLLFFCSLQSHSQKLVYRSNGNLLNSENQKISSNQVRELLKDNQQLLADYNAGRSKKTLGNVLLIGGFGFIAIDLATALTGDLTYPTALTGIGIAAIIIAVPVKIGFSKKIKNVVTEYNNQTDTGYKQFNEPKLDLITNSNGIGLRFTLN